MPRAFMCRVMLSALLAGVAAGLAVAVPLGAIGVLIVELGARCGLRAGLSAGLGTALCDGLYAAVAAFAGGAAAAALGTLERELALAAAAVLAAVGVHLLLGVRGPRPAATGGAPPRPGRLTLRFLALTAINPLTLAVFAGLVAGDADLADGPAASTAFVLGVLAASLAWQSALAGAGALLHRRLPDGAERVTRAAGGAIVIALALRTALGA